MRVGFQEELDQLEASLQEEGELVLRVLRGALNALAQGDVELADDVIAFDDDVDRHYIQIEEGIQSLLARQTPVATDLRLVLAMLHTNLHLERMADYAVTIAKLTKLVADVEGDATMQQTLQEMGERAEEMIRVALDAFANRDLAAAESLVELDELIDRSNLHLERMADYAVTIAKLTKLVADVEGDPTLLQTLQEMGERAEEMIRVALDAFANRDLAAAESLVELDELIDRSNRRFVERVVEIVGEPGLREWVLRMVLVSRTLERIGDHAVDIGEQISYLLTAEFREFTDASHPEQRA